MVIPKLKMMLAKSTSSLKVTLEVFEAWKEKGRQENIVAEKAQEALKAEVELIKVELAKEKAEAE